MKFFFTGFILLTTFISCSQKPSKLMGQVQVSEISNPISDPNLFIGKHKTKAMVLGVFHFANSTNDSYKQQHSFNILEVKRQKELDFLLEKMAAYKPTKILIEWNRIEFDSTTNMDYQKKIEAVRD